MSDYQRETQKLVENFVEALSEVWRRQAIDALGGAPSRGRAVAATKLDGRQSKRTKGELEEMSERFVEFVTKHPGMRVEQINKALGTSTKVLALPIRKLLADGMIKVKGRRRATAYFVGESQRKKAKS